MVGHSVRLLAVAARTRAIYDRQARERQGHGQTAPGQTLTENLPEASKGESRDAAGKAVGVSGKSVDYATKVMSSTTISSSELSARRKKSTA